MINQHVGDVPCRIMGAFRMSCSKTSAIDANIHELSSGTICTQKKKRANHPQIRTKTTMPQSQASHAPYESDNYRPWRHNRDHYPQSLSKASELLPVLGSMMMAQGGRLLPECGLDKLD